MKKRVVWLGVVLLLFVTAIASKDYISEDKLKKDYYELIALVSELFKDHAQIEGYYYNRSYSKEDQIAQLLSGKVTETGFHVVVNSLFEEVGNLYVYKEPYRKYVSNSRDFSLKEKQTNYYRTVRDTILNPGLGLIPFEELEISKNADEVEIRGENVKINFYENDDLLIEHHQYARFGFPPQDYISFSLTFVYKNGSYLLNDFFIEYYEV